MSTFKIDFFELMFLAEACIPPSTIARAMFWENISDVYYHQMSKDERARCFAWIHTLPRFKMANEDCRYFFARFNPENQFSVKTTFDGKTETTECFLFEGEYHISKNRFIQKEYINSVEQ